jgi:hypothetical protein
MFLPFLSIVGLLILESGCTTPQPTVQIPVAPQPTAKPVCQGRLQITVTSTPLLPHVVPPPPVLPTFPWPPPEASAQVKLSAFNGSNTLHDVDVLLRSALSDNCYYDQEYYAVPDGFALATRLEQIDADGKPKSEPERWSAQVFPPEVFDLTSFFQALLTANPGYFRVIAFVITSKPFVPNGKIDPTQVEQWLPKGPIQLPAEIGNLPFPSDHYAVALIYEFNQAAKGEKPRQLRMNESPPGVVHFQKSGLGSLVK